MRILISLLFSSYFIMDSSKPQCTSQIMWRKGLPCFGKYLKNLLTGSISGAIEMSGKLWCQQIKGRAIHRFPFLCSSLQSSGFLLGKTWRAACFP